MSSQDQNALTRIGIEHNKRQWRIGSVMDLCSAYICALWVPQKTRAPRRRNIRTATRSHCDVRWFGSDCEIRTLQNVFSFVPSQQKTNWINPADAVEMDNVPIRVKFTDRCLQGCETSVQLKTSLQPVNLEIPLTHRILAKLFILWNSTNCQKVMRWRAGKSVASSLRKENKTPSIFIQVLYAKQQLLKAHHRRPASFILVPHSQGYWDYTAKNALLNQPESVAGSKQTPFPRIHEGVFQYISFSCICLKTIG